MSTKPDQPAKPVVCSLTLGYDYSEDIGDTNTPLDARIRVLTTISNHYGELGSGAEFLRKAAQIRQVLERTDDPFPIRIFARQDADDVLDASDPSEWLELAVGAGEEEEEAPEAAEPEAAEPEAAEPEAAEPEAAEPEAAEPEAAEPEAADPEAADPEAADPEAADPEAADPGAEPSRGEVLRRFKQVLCRSQALFEEKPKKDCDPASRLESRPKPRPAR